MKRESKESGIAIDGDHIAFIPKNLAHFIEKKKIKLVTGKWIVHNVNPTQTGPITVSHFCSNWWRSSTGWDEGDPQCFSCEEKVPDNLKVMVRLFNEKIDGE